MTRSQARSLIMEGRIRVDGRVATKAGQSTNAAAAIDVAQPRRFVSRGGEKLESALENFGIDVTGKAALDVGASTGRIYGLPAPTGRGRGDGRRRRLRAARLAPA